VTAKTRVGPSRTTRDAFMDAYLAGTPAPVSTEGRAARAGVSRREPARAAPVESIALGGQILTRDGPVRGWITIEAGLISAISARKPTGARTVATDGVILPGLIDLHGHPEFNVFAPWEPPKGYVNRYAWRGSAPYKKLIRDPQNSLLSALPSGTQLRYAEIRALVGGATAIQGASARTQGSAESLVRNVDGVIFGEHRARSLIDLPASLSARGGDDLTKILAAITAKEVDAFYVHLAEGQRDNQRSIDEFTHLVSLNALTDATVIIHGTAMTRDQLASAADHGAKLVWSPQSNLRLYGQTTRVGDALDTGLPVALGADWLPSGSTSLLAEMKVARQELTNQNHPITAKQLVAMATTTAADIAGLGDKIGTLETGRPADVLILAQRDDDPYESVCLAYPTDVELVLIGGDLAYGRTDWITTLAQDPTNLRLEPVLAWGRPMLLDTSYQRKPLGDTTPSLQQLRTALTRVYPQVGPIWA
jgi:5-methylthioadenosine/S-adenosylhomocysteine deaminase